jgi:hypothetical protein
MVPKVFLSHSHFKSTSTVPHAHSARACMRAFSSRVTPSTSIHVDVKVGDGESVAVLMCSVHVYCSVTGLSSGSRNLQGSLGQSHAFIKPNTVGSRFSTRLRSQMFGCKSNRKTNTIQMA